MNNIVDTSLMVGLSEAVGLLFFILCSMKKCYSWLFLLLAQGSWFLYSYHLNKLDVVSLLLSSISIAAYLYIWDHSEYEYATMKERYIVITICLIAIGVCCISPSYSILPVNEVLFQILNIAGIMYLAFKILDGWIFLLIANLFCWQNTVQDTVFIILLGCLIYGFGFYNWKKDLT